MKAFKINSKPAIAIITAALSLSVKNKAGRQERKKIIVNLQHTMFRNRTKYGVDVLETDKFLFAGIMEIKAIEDTDDVSFIEEVQVEGELKKEKIDLAKEFSKILAQSRDPKLKTEEPKPISSKKEKCDCDFCATMERLKNYSSKN